MYRRDTGGFRGSQEETDKVKGAFLRYFKSPFVFETDASSVV